MKIYPPYRLIVCEFFGSEIFGVFLKRLNLQTHQSFLTDTSLITYQESDIIKAIEKQFTLILLQANGLQPLPNALLQHP